MRLTLGLRPRVSLFSGSPMTDNVRAPALRAYALTLPNCVWNPHRDRTTKPPTPPRSHPPLIRARSPRRRRDSGAQARSRGSWWRQWGAGDAGGEVGRPRVCHPPSLTSTQACYDPANSSPRGGGLIERQPKTMTTTSLISGGRVWVDPKTFAKRGYLRIAPDYYETNQRFNHLATGITLT